MLKDGTCTALSTKTLLRLAVLLGFAGLADGQAQHQWTEAENYGLRGPVHVLITTSKAVNAVPGTDQGLAAPVGMGWMEFDRHGSLLASGQDASKSGSALRNVYEYDEQGRMTVKGNWAADGETLIRQEYTYGPFGPVEVRWYSGKKFTGRTVVEYDKNGSFLRDASYDPDGHLTHESLKRQGEHTNTVEQKGRTADGTTTVHLLDRVDDKSAILEHQSLDEKGRIIGILRMHDGEFLSWWMNPDFQCALGQNEEGIFNWNDEKRRLQIYFNLRCPGTLEITRLHHAGKDGSLENDLEERTLEDGTVLERVEYEYARDAHENWTKRVVLQWDRKKNIMIAVREDQRTISYYEKSKGQQDR